LRKSLIGALSAILALALAAVALAQSPEPVVTTTGTFSPSKAGTKSRPKGASFKFKVVNTPESRSTVKTIRVLLPSEARMSGRNLPKCTEAQLRAGGSAACPRGSKLGEGVAYAYLIDAAQPVPDCPGTKGAAEGCLTFQNEFFVGGNAQLNVWLVSEGLGIQQVLPGKITKGGRQLDIQIPGSLQSPVQGVFAALSQLDGTWKGSARKRGKTYNFISTTGCKSGKWTTKTTLLYTPNGVAANVASKSGSYSQNCRK
jgi:hypothetical protein